MSEKQFLLIGVAIVILVVGAFGYLTYTEYQELQKLKGEVADLIKKIDGHREKIAKIKGLQEEINILDSEFEEQREKLPDSKELENLLEIISYLCTETGVDKPKRMKKQEVRGQPGAKAAVGGIEEIVYDCELDGKFFNFVKFLNWLEHYKRLIRVRTFALRGGGKKGEAKADRLQNPVLGYTLQLITYEYKAGEGAADRPREFNVEKPNIPKAEEIEIDSTKRDPFRFSLEVQPDGPVPPPVNGGVDIRGDGPEMDTALANAEERVGKLRARVLKIIGMPQASPEELRAVQAEFKDLEDVLKGLKPNSTPNRAKLETIKATLADVGKKMGELMQKLWKMVATKLNTEMGDLVTAKRYKEAVPPFLAFLAEFRDFERTGDMDKLLESVCDKVLNALERHVEENYEYDETIKLIEEIKRVLGPVASKPTNRVYKDFLERRDEKGNLVGGLAQVRKKAEDIKQFKGYKIDLRGVIWQPEPSSRVCIVLVPASLENKDDKRHVLREGDFIGMSKIADDRVRILEITPYKRVICGFRGLKIPLLLGEVERAKLGKK